MSVDGVIGELAGGDTPHAQGAVLCDAGDPLGVGGDGDRADDIRVACEWVARLQTRFDVPYAHCVVPRGADETAVVWEEGDASDGVSVTRQCAEWTDVFWSA